MITENSIHIKFKHLKGTWKVISSAVYKGKRIFLLEREQPGYKSGHLIVDEAGTIVSHEFLV